MSDAEEIRLTPRVKKVIKLAIDEARNLNHGSIGTEHFLLALVQDTEGIAVGILQSLGVNLEKVRTQTLLALSQSSTATESPMAHVLPSIPQEVTAFVAEKDSALLDRFDKLTEQARKVLSIAQEEAQRYPHKYIGTEHLLLGLIREGEGIAAKVLNDLGVQLDKVRKAVEFILGVGGRLDHAVAKEMRLTPGAEKVINLATDEARRMNYYSVGTEHLLLGLVREGEGIAAGILQGLGVTPDKVRIQTFDALSQSSPVTGSSGVFAPPSVDPVAKQGKEDFMMDNQSKEGISGSFGPDPDTYQAAGKLLAAEKSKWLCGSLLLRLITSPTHVFDMISRFSEYIEAEIPYLPPDEHTELLQMLFILGTAELITLRGVRFGRKYQAIEELRANLTQGLNGFFRAYIEVREVTNQPPDELSSTFMAEMQHGGKYLESFINRYCELTERQQGPFAGYAHCPAKCLYRPEVQSLLTQKNREWISEELTSQSHNTEMDRYSSVARAATNIVQGWLDDAGSTAIEKSVAGVAYCATLHTIANSNNYTAYEQAILGDNLYKHFF